MLDINTVIKNLSLRRSIFHSEADFQHSLAWMIHEKYPENEIRLEYPYRTKNQIFHVDIWMTGKDENIAMELKYKTRALRTVVNQEIYELQDQSAQDIGRYDYLVDIERVETICNLESNIKGITIFLSNDSAYWKIPNMDNTIDKDFRIHDGRNIQGLCKWGNQASKGTMKNREKPISIRGRYAINWQDYSKPGLGTYGDFRFNIIIIPCLV